MNKIARGLFFEKFYVHLAVIFQIAICLSFINYAIAVSNSYYSGYSDTYNFEEAEYFMSVSGNISSIYDKELLESTDSVIEFYYPEIILRDYNIYSYGQKTFERYCKKYMIAGQYKQSENDKINCLVVGDKSKLNQDIEATIYLKKYKFHVCGVLSNQTKSISTSISGDYATPGEVFKEFDDSSTNLICLVDDMGEIFTENNSLNTGLVYFGKDSDLVKEELSKYGILLAMSDIRYNADSSEYYIAIKVFSYLSTGLGIVGLVSTIGMFYLNIKQNETVFLTFNKLGLRRKHIITISTLYMLYFYMLLIPIIILLFKAYTVLIVVNVPLKFSQDNLIFTLIAMLMLYIINVVISLVVFKVGEKNE